MANTLPAANHILPDVNFVSDGVEELPAFLRDKKNYAKLVKWHCERWNTLDGEAIRLAYLRILDAASGSILDMLGARLGISRFDQSDTEYRALIKLRTLRQTKGDTRSDIVDLMKILFFGENPFITKGSNNFIETIIPSNCLADEDVSRQLEDMFPVNCNLWVTQTDAIPFYFIDGIGGDVPTGTSGFSDSKEAEVGGLLTNWIHSSSRVVKKTE